MDDHSFLYCRITCGGKTAVTLYLDYAHTAGAYFVKALPVAEGGDIDAYALGGIEYGCSLGNTYILVINSYAYHLYSLPPLSFPQPK